MSLYQWPRLCLVACIAVVLSATLGLRAEPAAEKPADAEAKKEAAVSVAVARDRAKVMQSIYSSTLEVMHHRYFHINRSTVPARAMEDIFDDMSRQSFGKARWISGNTKAMSIDHEPETSFEKQAVREFTIGKEELERVEDGYYQRATPIPLSGGCIGCHAGLSAEAGRTPRFAALVISIPVNEK